MNWMMAALNLNHKRVKNPAPLLNKKLSPQLQFRDNY